ncbi:MAG: hypothetical protein Q4D78_03975 [Neisseria zoodegmatis]|uniref:hypothetical protein n=1 Tax=Neisseria zoodegmatis TaxID=326523 RepID=UPI0026F2C5DC|nr:hypothetical protein [Neisseria zoodegmatis]MDO5069344.1 hypothetical protein [Neisseria zoodegmatis]
MSKLPMPDGIVKISLTNNYPCFYMGQGKHIEYITIENKYMKRPEKINISFSNQIGLDINKCYTYYDNNFRYNEVYSGFIYSNIQNSSEVHLFSFCIEKKGNFFRLVQVNETKSGLICSSQDWKPQKYYGGFFGWLEKLKDSIFNKDIIEYK